VVPIPAVADEVERPLWSVMIPTFNCGDTLRAALGSVLGQDAGAGRMQIEVVDDCSTRDDPEALVAEMGRGRVGFYRQPRNVGHVRNFNTCLRRSRGRLVHLLHGDDCVRDGFYEVMERGFRRRPDAGAAFCRYISAGVDGHWSTIAPLEQPVAGVLERWFEKLAVGQRL
jgi:glycosyltransferase involved in cell wall biosynthesis